MCLFVEGICNDKFLGSDIMNEGQILQNLPLLTAEAELETECYLN